MGALEQLVKRETSFIMTVILKQTKLEVLGVPVVNRDFLQLGNIVK